MANRLELPMPFSVAVFESSDKKSNKQRILKTKLIISLVSTTLAIGFLLICVCGSTINWGEDRVTLNIGSDMERSNSRPDKGKTTAQCSAQWQLHILGRRKTYEIDKQPKWIDLVMNWIIPVLLHSEFHFILYNSLVTDSKSIPLGFPEPSIMIKRKQGLLVEIKYA